MSLKSIIHQISVWHTQNLKVVLVTGVFDLLHLEHLRFLEKARSSGDKLVVGIESDIRVSEIKGPHRPLNPQAVRLEQLQHLKSIDLVFILPSDFTTQAAWSQLLIDLKPDIYAVSSHSSHLQNKQKLCQACGVKFQIVHPHNPEFSTTILESKLQTH